MEEKDSNNTAAAAGRPVRRIWIIAGIAAVLLLSLLAVFVTRGRGGSEADRAYSLGCKYLDDLDYKQALASFQEAIAIDPSDAASYFGAVKAYEGIGGDPSEMQDFYEKALETAEGLSAQQLADQQDSVIALFGEAENVYPGDTGKITAVLERALKLYPDSDEIRKKLEQYGISQESSTQGTDTAADQENDYSQVDLDILDCFELFGKKLYDWDYDSMAAYLEANYALDPNSPDGTPVYDGDVWSAMLMPELTPGVQGVTITYNSSKDPSLFPYNISISFGGKSTGEEVEIFYDKTYEPVPLPEEAAVFPMIGMSLQEYLDGISPDLFETAFAKKTTDGSYSEQSRVMTKNYGISFAEQTGGYYGISFAPIDVSGDSRCVIYNMTADDGTNLIRRVTIQGIPYEGVTKQ